MSASTSDVETRSFKVDLVKKALSGLARVGTVVYLIYVAIECYIYFLPVFVPDEINFVVLTSVLADATSPGWISGLIYRDNHVGYGSAYWTTYLNLYLLFGHWAIWSMRLIAFLASISIPIALSQSSCRTKPSVSYLASALWLTMPIAWWSGKISATEVIAMACLIHGVLQLFRSESEYIDTKKHKWNRLRLGWFLIGFAISLKLTMLPAFVFALVATFPVALEKKSIYIQRSFVFLANSGLACILGFIAGSPNCVFAPSQYLAQMYSVPQGPAWDWNIAMLHLNNKFWAWDGVFTGGVLHWSVGLPSFAILATTAMLIRPRVLVSSVVSFLVCWAILAKAGILLGWYWFGWITVLPLAVVHLFQLPISRSQLRFSTIAIAIAIVLNAFSQFGNLTAQIASKHEHYVAVLEMPKLNELINGLLEDQHFDVILDLSEVTPENGLQMKKAMGSEIFQTSPIAVWSNISASPFLKLHKLSEEGSEGKSTLIILSKRLARSQVFANIEKYLETSVLPKSPPGTTSRCISDLPNTWIYELRTAPLAL